ncbi:chemotaxis protein CheD [Bacillus oleivorans]|uniref:Chemoreceptor glutamine deamidase CheD n=2 Tax=Bacillus oleivorans TaxID=1448271 RepID=A0A285D3G8_9BACI|nr:chemotaxis protein CheD [Bacillus oleivorans]
MKLGQAPQILRTTGLGSCVGVVLFDEGLKIAGMAHVMLPDSSLARAGTNHSAKFADTAIPNLFALLLEKGARKLYIKAKLAGGAQMFHYSGANELMRIGARNIEAVKNQLKLLHLPVVAEDTGGTNGRTIDFVIETGVLLVKTVNKGVHEI